MDQLNILIKQKQDYENPKCAGGPNREVGTACEFYSNLENIEYKIPFLLIDCKSLPRSGLHFLKNSLEMMLLDHFSFCEWYQEPGCCKQMPCALTGFASHAAEHRDLRIRLIKSHDFGLDDPIYMTNSYIRRVVLVRDPLYILTSWFSLYQLEVYKEILASFGIKIEKIWMSHEREVVKHAYKLINEHFLGPSDEQLADWLHSNTEYMISFLRKWVRPNDLRFMDHIQVVRYEELNEYIGALADEFHSIMKPDQLESNSGISYYHSNKFSLRQDPFCSHSEEIAKYLRSNSALFEEAAKNVAISDEYLYCLTNHK